MSNRHSKQTGQTWIRRLIGLAVLVSLCASFVPLPVTIRSSSETDQKDQSEPFPCQHRPCGCNSAAQCWKSCCCFTNAQKLAWAKEHHVTPPAFVVEAARKESENAKICQLYDEVEPACEHCRTARSTTRTASACCLAGKIRCCDAKSKPCCEHAGSNQAKQEEESAVDDVNNETIYVIGVEMQKCRGIGPYWNSLPLAILPVPDLLVFRDIPLIWERPGNTAGAIVIQDPPEPPPRLA